eukprot:scaffold213_cov245-Pinguiococcus_pyrenoidosus.AAC.19
MAIKAGFHLVQKLGASVGRWTRRASPGRRPLIYRLHCRRQHIEQTRLGKSLADAAPPSVRFVTGLQLRSFERFAIRIPSARVDMGGGRALARKGSMARRPGSTIAEEVAVAAVAHIMIPMASKQASLAASLVHAELAGIAVKPVLLLTGFAGVAFPWISPARKTRPLNKERASARLCTVPDNLPRHHRIRYSTTRSTVFVAKANR